VTFSIAISGKGGTGKTTLATLFIRILHEATGDIVLAIDADPNSNLHSSLGVAPPRSVGEIREKMLAEKEKLPIEQTKEDYLNYMIQSSVLECEGFDLLAMGRPEGPGCYCYVNNLLRKIIDTLAANYRYVVLDSEAGLEHLSRRTTRDVDLLITVVDPTLKGILTAKRIKDLTRELGISVGRVLTIANRIPKDLEEKVSAEVKARGLELIGVVPEDPLIEQFDLEGRPTYQLPPNSPSYLSVKSILGLLGIPQLKTSVQFH
jgi:CO dehydrogenase maturation factor